MASRYSQDSGKSQQSSGGGGRRAPTGGAGSTHQSGLTNALLSLFQPREPLQPLPAPRRTRPRGLTGVADFVHHLTPADQEQLPDCPNLTPRERRTFFQRLRSERAQKENQIGLEHWSPWNDDKTTEDPYKTLFVARLSYSTTETTLRKEFEHFGPLKSIRLVTDSNTDKPKGYAFLEFESSQHMKEAYKRSDGKMIDGRRVKVDVERGRTVKDFTPMRLGGGLGGESRKPPEPSTSEAATELASSAPKKGPTAARGKAHPQSGRGATASSGKALLGAKKPDGHAKEDGDAHESKPDRDGGRNRQRDSEERRSSRRDKDKNRDERKRRSRSRSRSREKRRR